MNAKPTILELAQALIRRVSVTPEDAGCQELIGQLLQDMGFHIEQINAHGVHNLWAWRGADPAADAETAKAPHLMFAGHTDVVPSGPEEQWRTPPFEPTIKDGMLYGRGAADMKSSLAAMIHAVDSWLEGHPEHLGTLSFLITSDEEGDAIHGTRHAIDILASRGICPDYCVVGEPSSSQQLGDVVRCGRRGSLNGQVVVKGVQGHVAYPDSVTNPIHKAAPALAALAAEVGIRAMPSTRRRACRFPTFRPAPVQPTWCLENSKRSSTFALILNKPRPVCGSASRPSSANTNWIPSSPGSSGAAVFNPARRFDDSGSGRHRQ